MNRKGSNKIICKSNKNKISQGRNIYQTACGGSNDAIRLFQNLRPLLLKWQTAEGNNHLLNGMLYEIYFNRDGNIRNIGQVKTGWLDAVMQFENDKTYAKSFEFIRVQLEPYTSMLFYIPGNNSPIISFQIGLTEEKDVLGDPFYIIENILMNGQPVYDKPDFDCSITRSFKELKEDIKSYTAIPGQKMVIETNIANLEESQRVRINYPFSLKNNESNSFELCRMQPMLNNH